jgi:hypothetical protein
VRNTEVRVQFQGSPCGEQVDTGTGFSPSTSIFFYESSLYHCSIYITSGLSSRCHNIGLYSSVSISLSQGLPACDVAGRSSGGEVYDLSFRHLNSKSGSVESQARSGQNTFQ